MKQISKRLRIALVGWGAIGVTVWESLKARGSAIDLVGIAVRDPARHVFPQPVPRLLNHPEELLGVRPDLVVEVAGRDAVADRAFGAKNAMKSIVVDARSVGFCITALGHLSSPQSRPVFGHKEPKSDVTLSTSFRGAGAGEGRVCESGGDAGDCREAVAGFLRSASGTSGRGASRGPWVA